MGPQPRTAWKPPPSRLLRLSRLPVVAVRASVALPTVAPPVRCAPHSLRSLRCLRRPGSPRRRPLSVPPARIVESADKAFLAVRGW